MSAPSDNLSGMSLRDWFAGMVMSATMKTAIEMAATDPDWPQRIATISYAVADAMLAARHK
jgi:hypothetical protein